MNLTIPASTDIRGRLLALGHSQVQDLAKAANVPFTTLWKIRMGETKNPGIDTVKKFAHLLPELTPTPKKAKAVKVEG